MRRCLELAERGLLTGARPNPMVGSVIVSDGRIIGEGFHRKCGEGHAEVNAFAAVCPEDERLLHDATVYVSLEPCSHYGKTPPCCELIKSKGVRRVVVGCVDSFEKVSGRGIDSLRKAGIEVTVGVFEDECRWLNRRFFTFHEKHRPYIILKWAQSADGFIDCDGSAYSFSTPLTKMLVHKLRSEESAILVGHTTYVREHPRLDVRHWSGSSPVRFMLGKKGDDEGGAGYSADMGGKDTEKPVSIVGSIDSLFDECVDRQLQSVIVEGGRKTLQSFIDAGLWDEMRIETAPVILHKGTPAPVLPHDMLLMESRQCGVNTIERYRKRE